MKLSKTQMQREIVGQSALSLLASGIQFIEILKGWPTFDSAFEKAFNACRLEDFYPRILGLHYWDPQDLIDASIMHTEYKIKFARWYREKRDGRNLYGLRFVSRVDQERLECGEDSRGIVEEILSNEYGDFNEVSPFEAWPWTRFGVLMADELSPDGAALYSSKMQRVFVGNQA